MNRGKLSLFLFIFFVNAIMVLAAPPDIKEFTIESVLPKNLQFTWDVSDTAGLSKIQIEEDGRLVFEKDLTGVHDKDIYQINDDEEKHEFKFIVYNSLGMTTTVTKIKSDDKEPPVLSCASKITSNQKSISFTTNEAAICKIGKTQTNLTAISGDYRQNHTTELSLTEGFNRIFVQCFDRENNVMPGLFSIEYTYDTTGPSKVSNLKGEGNRLSWGPAEDSSGIDYYNIYNQVKSIASTYQNYWDAITEDSMYYVAAVDKAGNEGQKAELNLERARLLASNVTIAKSAEENKVAGGKEETKIKFPPTSETIKIGLIISGLFILLFICLKIYEHRTDPHGLKKYIKERRKLRDHHSRK